MTMQVNYDTVTQAASDTTKTASDLTEQLTTLMTHVRNVAGGWDGQRMLKRAGHSPVVVTTASALSHAFVTGKYEVVIATYADSGAVKKELEALPSRPGLLPIVYKTTKAVAAEAAAAYPCLLKPDKMTPFQALEEIDRLIDLRLTNTETSPTSR